MNSMIPEEIGHYKSLPLLQQLCRPLFHRLRRSSGSSQPLVIFNQGAKYPSGNFSSFVPSFRLASFRPSSGNWSSIPPIPFSPLSLPHFCSLAASTHHLVVVGGRGPDTISRSTDVYVYNFLSSTWSRGAHMPAVRSFFAIGANANNQVFVAGGIDKDMKPLKSAMVYDIMKDEWTMLPGMPRERDECKGAFVDGKVGGTFVVVGWGRFKSSVDVFDVGEWRWRAAEEEEAEEERGWARRCVAGEDGRVYMCCGEKMVVVKKGGEWKEVAELPKDVRVGTNMVGWGGGLMMIGMTFYDGVNVATAYVLELKKGTAIGWRRVIVPKEYYGDIQGSCCINI